MFICNKIYSLLFKNGRSATFMSFRAERKNGGGVKEDRFESTVGGCSVRHPTGGGHNLLEGGINDPLKDGKPPPPDPATLFLKTGLDYTLQTLQENARLARARNAELTRQFQVT